MPLPQQILDGGTPGDSGGEALTSGVAPVTAAGKLLSGPAARSQAPTGTSALAAAALGGGTPAGGKAPGANSALAKNKQEPVHRAQEGSGANLLQARLTALRMAERMPEKSARPSNPAHGTHSRLVVSPVGRTRPRVLLCKDVALASLASRPLEHSAALVHLPPPGEAKRKLHVEPLQAAAGSQAVTGGADERSGRAETLETSAAASSSEACDASASRASALSGEEAVGGAGPAGAGLTAQAAGVHDAKTGQATTAARGRGGEQGLAKTAVSKSEAHAIDMDEAIDHERFTQLAKQQPGWAPAPDGSQHLPFMSPVSDLAQGSKSKPAAAAESKPKSCVTFDPWTGEARKLRAETKKTFEGKKAMVQDKMAQDTSAAQFAAAQLAVRPEGDPVKVGSGGELNGGVRGDLGALLQQQNFDLLKLSTAAEGLAGNGGEGAGCASIKEKDTGDAAVQSVSTGTRQADPGVSPYVGNPGGASGAASRGQSWPGSIVQTPNSRYPNSCTDRTGASPAAGDVPPVQHGYASVFASARSSGAVGASGTKGLGSPSKSHALQIGSTPSASAEGRSGEDNNGHSLGMGNAAQAGADGTQWRAGAGVGGLEWRGLSGGVPGAGGLANALGGGMLPAGAAGAKGARSLFVGAESAGMAAGGIAATAVGGEDADGWEEWMGDEGLVDEAGKSDAARSVGALRAEAAAAAKGAGAGCSGDVCVPIKRPIATKVMASPARVGDARASSPVPKKAAASPSTSDQGALPTPLPSKGSSGSTSSPIKTCLANPWAVMLGDSLSSPGLGSPSASRGSRDKDSLHSPSKKLGGRKPRQGEVRCRALSIERVKSCLMALEGSLVVPGMPQASFPKGKSSAFTSAKSPEKDQHRLKVLRKLKDEMLEMRLPWKQLEGSAVSTADLHAQLDLCEKAMGKERELVQREEEKEALSGPTGLWMKKKHRLKLDYNKHSDYGSWFLTKFKSEHVPLSKADAFEDLRVLNATWNDASTVERTMRGRERKMPKHMLENAAPWQVLIPGRNRGGRDAAGLLGAAGSKTGREGRKRGDGEGEGEGDEDEDERDARRGALSIKSRTTIMTDLPAGWSGRAVTRQSSSQADIWMLAPDGSKLRSVVDVDNWYTMNKTVLSRHDRKLFEESCRIVRRKAAKLHQRQMGRAVFSEDEEAPGRRKGKGSLVSSRTGGGKGGSRGGHAVNMDDLKTICWDCKKGKFAQKHFSRSQCRHVQGHTACDWREDPREWNRKNELGGRKEVQMGEGGRCTKCGQVWVEEEIGGEDMRENGLLVCEDCRTVPLTRSDGYRSRRAEDCASGDESDGGGARPELGQKRPRQDDDDEGDDDQEEDDDEDEEEEEVYEAEDDETVAEIAARLGVDAHEMLRLNKGRYTGLTLNSRLFAGTLLLLPQDEDEDDEENSDDEDAGGGAARKPIKQVGRKRKGLTAGAPSATSGTGKGKRRRKDSSDSEDDGDGKSGPFATAHGHRRWGNRWGSGVIDPRCHGLSTANRPMQCSYSKCAMPTHSGRGDGEHGWKIVTSQTRAGNQDWGRLIGRVFCNACFMQFATRGTLVRPGRSTPGKGGSESGEASMVETPRDRESKFCSPGRSPVDKDGAGGSASGSRPRASGMSAKKLRHDACVYQGEEFWSHQYKRGVRCCFQACPEGGDGGRWMHVNEKTNAGARNWSRHIGRTFCKACFLYFAQHGSFAGRDRQPSGAAGNRRDGAGARGRQQDGGNKADASDEEDEEDEEDEDDDADDQDVDGLAEDADDVELDQDDEEGTEQAKKAKAPKSAASGGAGAGAGGPAGSKNKGSGYRKCQHCGVYCHWTQKCCNKTGNAQKRAGEEDASDVSSSASAPPAKKPRPDAAGKAEAAADDGDMVAEGRGMRAAAKSAAGAWSQLTGRRGPRDADSAAKGAGGDADAALARQGAADANSAPGKGNRTGAQDALGAPGAASPTLSGKAAKREHVDTAKKEYVDVEFPADDWSDDGERDGTHVGGETAKGTEEGAAKSSGPIQFKGAGLHVDVQCSGKGEPKPKAPTPKSVTPRGEGGREPRKSCASCKKVKCSCKNPKSGSQPPTPRLADCSPPLEEPTAPVGGGAEALAPAKTSASANDAGSGSMNSGSKLHTGRGASRSFGLSGLSASAKAFLTGKPSPAAPPVPAAASANASEGGEAAAGGERAGDDNSVPNAKVSPAAAAATEVGASEVAGAKDQSTPAPA